MLARPVATGFILAAIVAFGALMPGCDNSIDPFDEQSSDRYSLYGALTPGDDPNYIRVKDLSDPFTGDATKSLDVEVTFEELDNGPRITLEDTVVSFDGVFVHNYRVDHPREFGKTYRLAAQRPGGTTTAESKASIPDYSEPWTYTPVDRCDVNILFYFRNIENPNLLEEIRIGVRATADPRFFRISGSDLNEAQHEGEYFAAFSPQQIINRAYGTDTVGSWPDEEEVPRFECHDLNSDRIYVEYERMSTDWAGLNIRPMDPLESPDVDEGLGFIGGYYEHRYEVPIDTMDLPDCELGNPAACECPPEIFQDTCEPTIHEFDY